MLLLLGSGPGPARSGFVWPKTIAIPADLVILNEKPEMAIGWTTAAAGHGP